jgi:hypothetical protein
LNSNEQLREVRTEMLSKTVCIVGALLFFSGSTNAQEIRTWDDAFHKTFDMTYECYKTETLHAFNKMLDVDSTLTIIKAACKREQQLMADATYNLAIEKGHSPEEAQEIVQKSGRDLLKEILKMYAENLQKAKAKQH